MDLNALALYCSLKGTEFEVHYWNRSNGFRYRVVIYPYLDNETIYGEWAFTLEGALKDIMLKTSQREKPEC